MSFTDVIANPPADLAAWDLINRTEHNLHLKWPKRVRQMYRLHESKALRVDEDRQDHIDFPGFFLQPLVKSGLTLADAQVRVAADLVRLEEKTKHLFAIVKCCRVELEIRDLLIADSRHPVEPEEFDTVNEKDLSVETKTITSIDLSITRDPTG